MYKFFLGNLTLSSIPYTNPLIMGAFGSMILIAIVTMIIITILGKWRYLWSEWLTSLDHKRIGVMYVIVAIIMGLRGFSDGILMRYQQVLAYGPHHGFLPAYHFDEVFSGHGVIMIFFVAMPFIVGLINFAVPLQIGTRDVAFPFMNSVSLWLLIAAAILMNVSLGIGEFAKTGWVAYPPLSELPYSPGVGVDYYIWALQIGGVSSLLTGINFVTTILTLRAPGMHLMRMPLFTWTAFGAMLLVVGAFPILTVNIFLLTLDRYLGMHFFTNTAGGNMMLYVNWFWAWGHPEVYILILPAFGVFSEVVSNFSGRALFGYVSMVYSTMAITIISYLVWVHHFFIMGAGPSVNTTFGIATMIIAIPTGVKLFNWLFTMYHGKIQFTTPMLWTLGFIVTFVIGGMSGVMLAIPPADYVLHNSEFVIAHFHNTIIPGSIFGVIAGYIYWFPKAFGFKLDEKLGKWGFWFFILGFYITFIPLYILGFMGMTRRLDHIDNIHWMPPLIVAAAGIIFFSIGTIFIVLQLIVGLIKHKENRVGNDAWNGRSLEWSIPSPPPVYDFAVIPTVHSRDPYWDEKHAHKKPDAPQHIQDILLPKNSAAGIFIGLFSLLFGFCMTWSIWWLAIVGFIGIIVTIIIRTWRDDIYYYIPAEEIKMATSKQ